MGRALGDSRQGQSGGKPTGTKVRHVKQTTLTECLVGGYVQVNRSSQQKKKGKGGRAGVKITTGIKFSFTGSNQRWVYVNGGNHEKGGRSVQKSKTITVDWPRGQTEALRLTDNELAAKWKPETGGLRASKDKNTDPNLIRSV